MARLRKTGLNPCEELKKLNEKKVSSGATITGVGSEASSSRPPRIKTLTRAARSEFPKVKAELKNILPTLTAVDVRRHRIAYCDSVVLELEEDGFRDSAEYISMLFELDEKMRREAGPASVIWKNPMLKDQKSLLKRLRDGLTSAETAKTSGKIFGQTAAFLDTALFFESQTWEWYWIAEQLFRSSLKMAENILDDGLTLNVTRYLYGRFLFEKVKDPQKAIDYLNKVRVASEGRSWNASQIIGTKQSSLYSESCNLLHSALLNFSRQIRNDDPELSIKAATQALERATDSINDEFIAAALYEVGKSQLSAGNVESALRPLSKFLAIAKRIPDPEGICNAHMELAFAYKKLDNSEGTVKHLGLLRESSLKYELPYKLAQAHYYTGEYLLNKNQANLATPHLELSLRQFDDLGKRTEADRARCAAGVSKGQEVMDRYTNLILACGAGDTEATLKICRWKNSRVPFWISSKTEGNEADEKTIDGSENADRADIFDTSKESTSSPSPASTTRSKSTGAENEIVQQTVEA